MRTFFMPADDEPVVDRQEAEFKKMKFKSVARDVEDVDRVVDASERLEFDKLRAHIKTQAASRHDEITFVKYTMLYLNDTRANLILAAAKNALLAELPRSQLLRDPQSQSYALMERAASLIARRNDDISDLNDGEAAEPRDMKQIRVDFDELFKQLYALPATSDLADPHGTPQRNNVPRQLFTSVVPDANQIFLKKLMKELSVLVREGMQPVYTFLGMVAVRLGMNSPASLYKYHKSRRDEELEARQDPVVKTDATNVQEFLVNNRHLGRPLLELFLRAALKKENLLGTDKQSAQTFDQFWDSRNREPEIVHRAEQSTFVGALVDQADQDFLNAYLDRVMPANVVAYGAQWIYGALDFEAVRYVVDNTCWGAIAMALSQLRRIPNCANYELKQLMLSSGVSDQFAFLCAVAFLTGSGGNASMGRVGVNQNGKLNNTTYNLTAGFKTRVNIAAQMECARYWFERVFEEDNPSYTKMLSDLDVYDALHGPVMGVAYLGRTDVDFERMSTALAAAGGMVGRVDFIAHQLRSDKVEKLRISRQMVKRLLVHYE